MATNWETYIWTELVWVSPTIHAQEVAKIEPWLWERKTQTHYLDWRYWLNNQQNLDDICSHFLNVDNGYRQVLWLFYLILSNVSIPQNYWRLNDWYKYLYYVDFRNTTILNNTFDLNIPIDCDNFARMYFNVRRTTNVSLWAYGITDFGTTLRNAKNLYIIYIQRQEMTSAQQLAMTQSIEREILAWMWEDYTSTSTSARLIWFNNNSSWFNAPLVQADFVADGWTIINWTSLEKWITNPKNWIAYRWRILHR